jgi:flagellar biosynthesis protein FlhB
MTGRQGPYALGFTTLDREVADIGLTVEGALPPWLSGSLIRTAPARFEVGEQGYKHWFDGDPHVKAKLKQIRAQRSRQRMMQNVPKATVIVTNPTHYSVALRYEAGDAAPVCVAKGVDAIALRIREVAREHDVPIVENVPLARALYAAVDIDETIPREHFEAAAKVIGFVMQKRKRR